MPEVPCRRQRVLSLGGVVHEVKQSPRLSRDDGGFAWQICRRVVSAVWRRWSSALIAASGSSSGQAALALRSSHHRQPALGCRIE